MEAAPCGVCGGTDSNLVDGYYYCAECGTQDATAREMVVEYIAREDGTFAHTTSKKIVTTAPLAHDLSPEWYKWHVHNFVLAGLAGELAALGAADGFRLRLLWLWAKYVRKYREKPERRDGPTDGIRNSTTEDRSTFEDRNHSEPLDSDDNVQSDEEEYNPSSHKLARKYSVCKLNMLVMQAMLYTALNASDSEIQAGDLIRFIKEERVTCKNCLRFVPADFKNEKVINVDSITKSYTKIISSLKMRGCAMTLYKTLNLGKPPSANLQKLVSRYVTELCLPAGFKKIVFSLMDFIPVSLELDFTEGIQRLPDYEGVCMAYIIIALKICFGLDGYYENALSDAVGKHNEVNSHAKVYKDSLFMDGSDRLFSFREWSVHMEFRKQIISKYFFPVAMHCKSVIDSQTFISHTKDRVKRDMPTDISDEVMMDILDKLRGNIEEFTAPKISFPPSLTPLTTYSDILLRKLDDPILKELLGEDFSQYSIKYVTEDVELDNEALKSGVSLDNLTIFPEERIKHENLKLAKNLVFVRNCENDNWLQTKPPKAKHLDMDDNNSDSYCVSNKESISDSESTDVSVKNEHSNENESKESNFNLENDQKDAKFDPNDEIGNIFDDDFDVSKDQLWCGWTPTDVDEPNIENKNTVEIDCSFNDDCISNHLQNESKFDAEKFDREAAIEKLLENARNKYKIPTAAVRVPPKRKSHLIDATANTDNFIIPLPKKLRTKPKICAKYGEAKLEVKEICERYCSIMTVRQKNVLDINKILNNEDIAQDFDTFHKIQINETNQFKNLSDINGSQDVGEMVGIIGNVRNSDQRNITSEECKTDDALNISDVNNEDSNKINKYCQLFTSPTKKNNDFDENIYDTKQLYLKLKGNLEETAETEDPKIIEILRRKDNEATITKKKERLTLRDLGGKVQENCNQLKGGLATKEENSWDSDDLSLRSNLHTNSPLAQSRLFTNDSYNYWIRHYYAPPKAFDSELDCRFPRSFTWVMRMCAGMIESTTGTLYTHMSHLESDLKATLELK